jgi:hypothetical protein
MKISVETISILKNFATINTGILITPGNKLWSRTGSVFGEAVVTETFPREVGILDVNNFLATLSLFTDPDLDFGAEYLTITDVSGKMHVRYLYAGTGIVALTYPKTPKSLPEKIITFTLTEDQWQKTQKATGIFDQKELVIASDGKIIRIGTIDHKNKNGNLFTMDLDGETNGLKCHTVFSKEHLPLLKGSYQGTITPSYAIFKNTNIDLHYFVGCEPNTSTFGAGA